MDLNPLGSLSTFVFRPRYEGPTVGPALSGAEYAEAFAEYRGMSTSGRMFSIFDDFQVKFTDLQQLDTIVVGARGQGGSRAGNRHAERSGSLTASRVRSRLPPSQSWSRHRTAPPPHQIPMLSSGDSATLPMFATLMSR